MRCAASKLDIRTKPFSSELERIGVSRMSGSGPQSESKMVVEGATKSYQTKSGFAHALDKVSLEVREGEFISTIKI
jgi:ABC-type glutathione transport system ATPase component